MIFQRPNKATLVNLYSFSINQHIDIAMHAHTHRYAHIHTLLSIFVANKWDQYKTIDTPHEVNLFPYTWVALTWTLEGGKFEPDRKVINNDILFILRLRVLQTNKRTIKGSK